MLVFPLGSLEAVLGGSIVDIFLVVSLGGSAAILNIHLNCK
jgi:hypothetical protein